MSRAEEGRSRREYTGSQREKKRSPSLHNLGEFGCATSGESRRYCGGAAPVGTGAKHPSLSSTAVSVTPQNHLFQSVVQ